MCDYSLELVASRPAKVWRGAGIDELPPHDYARFCFRRRPQRGRLFASRHRACLRQRGSVRDRHALRLETWAEGG